jgi:hypothetical protein
VGEGLFTLAARKSGAGLSPSLQYWRDFACKYLSERCLLAPVQLAAESSVVIKDLVDTGDIYHPLAWSPEEAYAFRKEVAQKSSIV